MFKGKFEDIVLPKEGFLRGPFGSALKKSLFVPKSNNTYKVYEQGVVLQQDKNVGEYYISKEYFEESLQRFEVKTGDFLVSCSGVNYGAIYQLKGEIEKGVINQALLRIRLNNEIIDDNYFLYYFKAYIVKKIVGGTGDSTIPNFPPMSVIKNIEIELPDIEEQRKIGEMLASIDNKIDNNNAINSELESMAKTIYDYWFLQFEFPNEEGKPYKSSGGKMVWNEELKREIPEGWEIKFCKDILDVITGKEDANHSTIDGEYPFFTCGIDPLKCDDYKFEGKMILIAGNGDFNVKYYEGKCNAYQRTYVLIPNEEKYIGLLYQNAIRKINSFKAGSNGSIVKFITKGDVEKIELLVPDNDKLMNTFNEILSTIEHYKKENQELASLRDFLLPLLMNGQVGFKEVTNG